MQIWKEKISSTKYKWHANFVCAGRRYRPEADSKDELDEIIEAIKGRARKEKYGVHIEEEPITLGELLEERKKYFDLTKKSHRSAQRVVEKFVDVLGEDTPVRSIKQAHVRKYIAARRLQNKELGATTINNELNHVNAMLHAASTYFPDLDDWKSPRMPFEFVEEGEDRRDRLITEEEQALLFFHLRAPAGKTGGEKHPRREKPEEVKTRHTVADLMETALLTGLRHTETRLLDDERVDLRVQAFREARGQEFISYGEVRPVRLKRGPRRSVPLNRDAHDILERRTKEKHGRWLFPNAAETGPISMTAVYKVLRRVCLKAGLNYGRFAEGGFVFHDARHTAVTRMLAATNFDLKTVGQIVGHTDETMTMRYAHSTPERRARAVASLERGPKRASNEEAMNKK